MSLLGNVRVSTSGLPVNQQTWYGEDVYVEVLRGHFVDKYVPIPDHARPPSGPFFIAVIDAHTGDITSVAVGPNAPSDQLLHAAGTVAKLR